MLKIEDNVDLKELEKYGFENGMRDLKNDEYSYVSILANRELYTMYNDDEYFVPTKEYEVDDLIKDGLVVKVDE
ncbi:MAG: hypothetical protein IKL65_00180 [Bacilli bacterium]|nr:hypothetical protein [Bacilli bacterium]